MSQLTRPKATRPWPPVVARGHVVFPVAARVWWNQVDCDLSVRNIQCFQARVRAPRPHYARHRPGREARLGTQSVSSGSTPAPPPTTPAPRPQSGEAAATGSDETADRTAPR